MNICPNKNNEFYKQTVQVLGEELAHLVFARNNGNFIDKDFEGNDSKLYQEILQSTTSENEAIRIKSKLYSSNIFKRLKSKEEPSYDEFVNILQSVEDSNTMFAPNVKNTQPLSKVISELNIIRNNIFQEKDSDSFNKSRQLRLESLAEDISSLNNINNPLVNLMVIANKHYNYFNNLVNKYDFKTTSVDEIGSLSTLMDFWLRIKDLVGDDIRDSEELLLMQSKFDSLNKKFKEIKLDSFIRESNLGVVITKEKLTTELDDRNVLSSFLLASGRTSNVAVQAINKFLDLAYVAKKRESNNLQDELFNIEKVVKENKIDTKDFLSVNKEGKEPSLRLIKAFMSSWMEDERVLQLRKNRVNDLNGAKEVWKEQSLNHKVRGTVLNLKNLFIETEEGYVINQDNLQSEIKDISNKIDVENKELVSYVIQEKINQQLTLLNKYFKDAKTRKEISTEEDFIKWNNINNPFLYIENLNKDKPNYFSSRKYVVSLPVLKQFWNNDFEKIFKDSKKLEVYNKLSQVIDDLKSKLPANIRNRIEEDFVPIVDSYLIKEGLSFQEQIKDLIKLPNFTASDNINDYKEIPIHFIPEKGEHKNSANFTQEKGDFSTNLIPLLKLFGDSVYHYYYYTQVKAPVLLGQSILQNATPLQKDYKGNIVIERGKGTDKKYDEGQGLSNELTLLEETINHVMFLEKTKPEINIFSNYNVTDLSGILAIINENKKALKNKKIYSPFTEKELNEEIELVNNVQKNINDSLSKGIFSKINSIKNQFTKKYRGENYNDAETLYNYYLDKLDTARKLRREGKITKEEFIQTNDLIQKRIRELNRSSIYFSKITDYLIKVRRTISLGLNPFSAGRNFIGGYFNGIVNAGQEYDSIVFTKNVGKVTSLMISNIVKDKQEAFKIFKLAQKLLVQDNVIDLQGLDEKTWFDNYGFKLMEKSEQAVRYALMLSVLEKDNLYSKFDDNGDWIGEKQDNNIIEQDIINNTILKIQRINDIVMGDTHSFKLINKSFVGRLVGQFKVSWMPEAFASRLEKEHYDYKLDRTIKGRYLTYSDLGLTGSLVGILQVYKSWVFGSKDYVHLKNNKGRKITETDANNLVKNTIELSLIMSFMTLGYILRYLADDEEDDALLTFVINQSLLIERDLTVISPSTVSEIVAGNLIPAYSVVTNLQSLIPATVKVTSDDDYDFDKYLYKLGKLVPVLNIASQFKYQSEHFVDDLN